MEIDTPSLSEGCFVQVRVSAHKQTLGRITSIDAGAGVITVATNSGFSVKAQASNVRRAVLVILDLNGVLGSRTSSKVVIARPGVEELLTFLFNNCVVGVWTSSVEANGRRFIEEVFGAKFAPKLLFTWFRDRCTPHHSPTATSFATIKDLNHVWREFPSFDATNTIIVDDSKDKCTHPTNSICPPRYDRAQPVAGDPDRGLFITTELLAEVVESRSFAAVANQSAKFGGAAAAPHPGLSPECQTGLTDSLPDFSVKALSSSPSALLSAAVGPFPMHPPASAVAAASVATEARKKGPPPATAVAQ